MRRLTTALATFGLLLTLAACGGDTDSTTTDAVEPSATPAEGRGPGGDPDQFAEIQQCLAAAGLDDAMPTDRPTDRPSEMPSEMPTERPTDLPEGGGPGGMVQDPEVQAALEACGITVPSGGPASPPAS